MRGTMDLLGDRIMAQGFRQIKHVRVVGIREATGLVAAVYGQLSRDMQIVPPAVVHSPIPELLAGAWCMLRETLIAGSVPRLLKEAVAIGVSHANACPYCVDAHSLCLPKDALEWTKVLKGAGGGDLAALARWASQGSPRSIVSTPLVWFDGHSAAEVLGTAVAFHYFNRIVNVFLPPSPLSLPLGLGWAKGLLRQVARSFGKRLTSATARPGDSLLLLKPAELPPDLLWAQRNPIVADALARMARVVDNLAVTLIPPEVQMLVASRIARWNGEPLGLDRSWVAATVRILDEPDRPLASLLLLTALASHQVDDSVVVAARAGIADQNASGRGLLGAVAWAAFSAARRAGTWLHGYHEIASPALAVEH